MKRKRGGVDALVDEPLHSDLSLLLLAERRRRQYLFEEIINP